MPRRRRPQGNVNAPEKINLYRENPLLDLLQEYIPAIDEIRDKEIFLVLGDTKAGKSTLIAELLLAKYGLSFVVKPHPEYGPDEFELLLPPDLDMKAPGLRQKLPELGKYGDKGSVTRAPKIYDGCFCDCPGFNASQSPQEELMAMITTWMLTLKARIRGVMLVVENASLKVPRGMRDLSSLLGQIFVDPCSEAFKKALTLVVTKEPRISPRGVDFQIEGSMASLLSSMEAETKGKQKESLKKQLRILQVMRELIGDHRLVIADPARNVARQRITALLGQLPADGLPRDQFIFKRNDNDETMRNFRMDLQTLIEQLVGAVETAQQQASVLEEATAKYAACQESITLLRRGIGPELMPIRQEIEGIEATIQAVTRQREAKTKELEALQKELVSFDEEILHRTFLCNEAIGTFFGTWGDTIDGATSALAKAGVVTGKKGGAVIGGIAGSISGGPMGTVAGVGAGYAVGFVTGGVIGTTVGVTGGTVFGFFRGIYKANFDQIDKAYAYQGVPFSKVTKGPIVGTNLHGQWSNEYSSGDHTSYSIRYMSNQGEDANGKVEIFVFKRDLPENVQTVQGLRERIAAAEREKQDLQARLAQEQGKLIERKRALETQTRQRLAEKENELPLLQAKVLELKTILTERFLRLLYQDRKSFDLMREFLDFIRVLNGDHTDNEALLRKFEMQCQWMRERFDEYHFAEEEIPMPPNPAAAPDVREAPAFFHAPGAFFAPPATARDAAPADSAGERPQARCA
ncbi:MAG: hypothetical protein A2103_04440 [Gammaproteobacteria bacterium GWF2_41_13]|nr:MAG: hypothetical protein A2103_04440 [Gammaproteobacteria bacterium GWF2_41_13]